MEYYVFNDEQTAINAELYIREHGNLPLTGINALTGLPEPEKAKTEKWAIPQQRLDGKWVFPRLSEYFRMNCTEEEITTFFTSFNPTIETYNNDWFPQEEII
jgi:hypothetical protein